MIYSVYNIYLGFHQFDHANYKKIIYGPQNTTRNIKDYETQTTLKTHVLMMCK